MSRILSLHLVLFFLIPIFISKPVHGFTQVKGLVLPPIGEFASQYSPYVYTRQGSLNSVMYYCKNTVISGLARDRVWRIEYFPELGWVNDMVVIDGVLNTPDDMSCSPGLVIGPDGKWHLYFIAGDRRYSGQLYLLHAVADAPGVNWTKLGAITGMTQPFPHYIETPSSFYLDGKFILYIHGDNGELWRTESADGHNYSSPVKIYQNPLQRGNAGRVSILNNKWYYLYSLNPDIRRGAPTEIWMASSVDGINWGNEIKIHQVSPAGWDSTYAWSPHLVYDYRRQEAVVYYAGNSGTYNWWGANTAIGWRNLNPLLLASTAPIAGDLTGDGHVNLADYNLLVSKFGTTYTLADYNALVSNFGN